MRRTFGLPLLGLCCLGLFVPARGKARSLEHVLRDLVERAPSGGASWGVMMQGLDSDESYEWHSDQRFVPASTAKLFTAFAAAWLLPSDTVFATTVRLQGQRQGPTLNGDLTVTGLGAPGLRTRDSRDSLDPRPPGRLVLDEIAFRVRQAGIYELQGDVVVDPSFYPEGEEVGHGWEAEDLAWWYGAPVTPLALDDNALPATFTVLADGSVECRGDSLPYGWELGSRVTRGPAGRGSDIRIRWTDNRHPVFFGRLAPGERDHRESVALADPELYFVDFLRDALERAGVRVLSEGPPPATTPERGRRRHRTRPAPAASPAAFSAEFRIPFPPLAGIYHPILARSQNLQAEMLLRNLGASRRGSASVDSGLAVVGSVLDSLGLDPSAVRLVDGSGLSRMNLATPRSLCVLLERAVRAADRGHPGMQALLAGMARPGESGSMRTRVADLADSTRARGWLRAKTGSMDGVCSIAALVRSRSGKRYVLVSIQNHLAGPVANARPREDQLLRVLAGRD